MATGNIGYDTGWYIYTNPSLFSGKFYLRKIDKLFILASGWINLVTALPAKTYVDLASGNPIPAAYRPTENLVCSGFINTGLVDSRFLPLAISPTGTLYIYAGVDAITTGYNLRFSVVGL